MLIYICSVWMAAKGKMEIVIGVSVGSSIQIAGQSMDHRYSVQVADVEYPGSDSRRYSYPGPCWVGYGTRTHSLLWGKPRLRCQSSNLLIGSVQNFETMCLFISVLLVNSLLQGQASSSFVYSIVSWYGVVKMANLITLRGKLILWDAMLMLIEPFRLMLVSLYVVIALWALLCRVLV